MDLPITAADLLLGFQIAISVMAVVVLYHVIFIVVDLRKVLRRVDDITEQVEAIILKPIALADQVLQKVMQLIESGTTKKHKHKKHHEVVEG